MQDPRQLAAAVKRLQRLELQECFDPARKGSRPNAAQQAVLDDIGVISHRYVTAGNQSGKSQLAAREVAWVLTETHPKWKRPKEWGDAPLQILVVGRVTKQVEEVLHRKIVGFLEPDTYHIQRQGGVVQKLTYKPTGNTILYASHHNEKEAQEKLQGFVAHYVWLDEMPGSVKLLEELHRRVQAHKGYFLSTFTPKQINRDIQRLIDTSDGFNSKKYQFKMFDNPIYTDEDKLKILSSLSTYSEAYKNTVLSGDWLTGDDMVYFFDREMMVKDPPNYSPSWRHVESSDPATKSKFGFTIWAEDPATGMWYCIRADYISGIFVPSELVKEVQKRTAGINIVRRICDSANPWYAATAATLGLTYMTPYRKNDRKADLIKGLQSAIGPKIQIASWCTDLIDEFETCRWSETAANKIVNSSSFHLLDSAQYFVDCMPRYEGIPMSTNWQAELRLANEERKKQTKLTAQLSSNNRKYWKITRGRSRW